MRRWVVRQRVKPFTYFYLKIMPNPWDETACDRQATDLAEATRFVRDAAYMWTRRLNNIAKREGKPIYYDMVEVER